jgi:hypothetical protein
MGASVGDDDTDLMIFFLFSGDRVRGARSSICTCISAVGASCAARPTVLTGAWTAPSGYVSLG